MIQRNARRLVAALLAAAAALSAGCESGFINDAARTSLASFLTSIATTAVNETVEP